MTDKTKRHSSPSNSNAWTRALIGLVVIIGAIWGLVTLYETDNRLVPYTKYKKTAVESAENDSRDTAKPEATASDAVETVASTSDPEVAPEAGDDALLDELIRPKAPTVNLPRKTLEHISKGMGLAEQGQFELAELEFEQASQISPNSAEVYAIWGAAHRMQGKFEGANKRFARAYELAPDDEEIVFNWALSRLHEKNADEAIKLFKKTIVLAPGHYMAYNYLGKSHGLKKEYHKEAAAYEKALEIKEDFAQAHFNLGVVLSLMKEFDQAAPHFVRAIELDKEFDKPFVNQFLVAMGLRKNQMRDDLKEAKKEQEKKEEIAKADLKPEEKKGAEQHEGSHDKKEEEGSEGSDNKIVAPITQVSGTVTVNGEAASGPGLVILETKSKLKVPDQKAQKVTIEQRGLQFEPAHTVVMIGSTVEFVNNDKEVHNIYSKSRNNQFNLGAMAAGTARAITLDTPGPVVLRCNLHKDMIGTLFVVPNGYFARIDGNGKYQFKDVKSQEYILQFWHPRMAPEEVEANIKSVALTGVDQTLDFTIKSQSQPGEIHDMVDPTDYNLLVKNIETEVLAAIQNWKEGKKYLSHKRMLKAITYYFDGGGLKGAIAKSFSDKRSQNLEKALDDIRKKIAGLKGDPDELSEKELNGMAERAFAQLKNNVQELYARINPDQAATKQ